MSDRCSYCSSPISGQALSGRPRPDRPAARYCCFGCLSLGEQVSAKPAGWDGRILRWLLCLLLAGQSMALSLAINITPPEDATTRMVLQALVLVAAVTVIALLGRPLLESAIRELLHFRATIEALFLISIAGAMAASLHSFLTGNGPVYFEVVAILLVVYSFGRQIGARKRASALAAVQHWNYSLAKARRIDADGREANVEVAAIQPGDVVEVRPGELSPVDGVIRTGAGFLSEAPVSGEPFAVVRRPGDRVLAGCASFDATLRIEATYAGTARQIDRLLAAVELAREAPASLARRADRLGRIFLPLILTVAGLTFAYWTWAADWHTGLFNALSVLLVACPCAIGLATPIVLWSALGRLAERGLLVRSGEALERLAEVDYVIFDKTGTLTDDEFGLVDVSTAFQGEERTSFLGWLRAVEAHSRHPVARAFAARAANAEPDALARASLAYASGSADSANVQILSFRTIPGAGVEAEIKAENDSRHFLRIGRPEWLGHAERPESARLLTGLHARNGHRIDVELDGRLAGIAMLSERLRDSVAETLAAFQTMDLPAEVWTGDNAERAAAAGFPMALASLSPDDKCRKMAELNAAGSRALFVGDGINDAGALASAHIGVALASGTDLANSAAVATLYRGDLRVLPWAVALARQSVEIMQRTLWRAGLYNLVGITLAALGVLHPVVAALLMVASSLLVAWSASRTGFMPVRCESRCRERLQQESLRLRIAALVHVLALAFQGWLWARMLSVSPATATLLITVFAACGIILTGLWYRWRDIPHHLDMAFDMITLGNLGMLFGWWVDLHFQTFPACPACCANPAGSWGMWSGMLLAANLAMGLLGRRNYDASWREWLGCNLGMCAGMIIGGSIMNSTPFSHFLGMALGMLLGMAIGHEILPAFWPAKRAAVV
ncbi:MAG TPA: cation-translocating P-type ATPase [Gemmataceae bacterium]|jgi:heavy metal translocating P-type ATPase|nr:cation-translocating P-type ATPase [Gemmataceae bacterium]